MGVLLRVETRCLRSQVARLWTVMSASEWPRISAKSRDKPTDDDRWRGQAKGALAKRTRRGATERVARELVDAVDQAVDSLVAKRMRSNPVQ